jgi:hypothetical protein
MAGMSHFAHDKTIVVKAKKTIACIFIIIVLIKGEFNLEVQHTSKVKTKQLFTVFQRHLVTEKLMGIIHYFRPCMDWSGVEGISEILYLVILIEEERPVNR